VLFSSHPCTSFAHLAEARAAGMKIVLLDHDFPGFECDSVAIDDQLGGFEATAHLIQLGCAGLVHVTFRQEWTSCLLRQKGFEMAANRFGRGRNAAVVLLETDYNPDRVREALGRELPPILDSTQRPLGLLVVNDYLALLVMDYLRERGIAVPKEVAVVGFDNDLEGALAAVPLTTVEIPREEIARDAVRLLMEQINGERRGPMRTRHKPRLILRKSCGCYPMQTQTSPVERKAAQCVA
jgi:LacI family transcriptional regulator